MKSNVIIILSIVLVGLGVLLFLREDKSKLIKISGSSTFNSAIFNSSKDKIEKESGLKLTVQVSDSLTGVNDLLQGKTDIAMTSAALSSLETKITEPGIEGLQENLVGVLDIAFIINKNNNIANISPDEAKSILTGKITNWSQLNGPDMPITIITSTDQTGLRATLENKITHGPIQGSIKSFNEEHFIIDEVAKTPGAFGVVDKKYINDNVLEIVALSATESFYLVIKGAPNHDDEKLIDVIKNIEIR
jgi:phosphate transport system substrate-binding protein